MKKLIEKFKSLFNSKKVPFGEHEKIKVKPKEIKIAKKKVKKAFKPKAELVDIECPGCEAQMKVPKLNELQEVTCKECGLSSEIEI